MTQPTPPPQPTLKDIITALDQATLPANAGKLSRVDFAIVEQSISLLRESNKEQKNQDLDKAINILDISTQPYSINKLSRLDYLNAENALNFLKEIDKKQTAESGNTGDTKV